MALLECKNVSLSYEGKRVVEGLNLVVEPGDYLCIVGENGSGKSTLVKGILGLHAPSAGSIAFGEGLRQNEIGYLPQRAKMRQDFPASVREVVASGCRGNAPFLSKKQKKNVMEVMTLLAIEPHQKERFSELSGGQQQRVLLARALLATSKLLLLDEPAAGLDPLITKELYTLIETLHRERGLTVIMVSHDVEAAIGFADHILHMANGPMFYGTALEYARSPLGKAFARGEEDA